MQIKSVIPHLPLFSTLLAASEKRHNASPLSESLLALLLATLTYTSTVLAEGDNIKSLVDQAGVYTLTNLHPDEARSKLYSINFQQAGLIPLCTEVEIVKANRKQIKFKVKETGKEYKYDHHRNAGEDLDANAAKYFGKQCNKDNVAKLSEVDQDGVKQGRALVGMSKQGVIYAIGYPPVAKTPTLDATVWKYWSNRFNTFDVVFSADGKVTHVNN